MMNRNVIIVCFSLLLTACNSNNENTGTTDLKLHLTSDSLVLFGENVISTPLYERDIAISPEGNEIIYTLGDYKQNRRGLIKLSKQDMKWGNPELLNISGKYQDIEPFYDPNGGRLYFASNRPIYNDTSRRDYNIWYCEKSEGRWLDPQPLDSIINTRGNEFFPSLTKTGTLFFTATREDGIGREDIFMSGFVKGSFQYPKPLPVEINSARYEFNAYVSPEEDLIIFSSYGREDGFGGGDLYFSRKDQNGNWTPSKNLGSLINSDKLDYCPFIDWESRNFYFTSERFMEDKTELENINQLKQKANSILNGFGNIYRIGLDELGME